MSRFIPIELHHASRLLNQGSPQNSEKIVR